MAKERKDLLKRGLSSILYYKAYPGPKSIRQISIEFYGKDMPVNFYAWKKKLIEKGWIKPVKKANFPHHLISTPMPLVEEIEKKVRLEDDERELLNKILNSEGFRSFIWYQNYNMIDWSRINGDSGIDATKHILEAFDYIMSFCYCIKKLVPELDIQVSLKELNSEWDEEAVGQK